MNREQVENDEIHIANHVIRDETHKNEMRKIWKTKFETDPDKNTAHKLFFLSVYIFNEAQPIVSRTFQRISKLLEKYEKPAAIDLEFEPNWLAEIAYDAYTVFKATNNCSPILKENTLRSALDIFAEFIDDNYGITLRAPLRGDKFKFDSIMSNAMSIVPSNDLNLGNFWSPLLGADDTTNPLFKVAFQMEALSEITRKTILMKNLLYSNASIPAKIMHKLKNAPLA